VLLTVFIVVVVVLVILVGVEVYLRAVIGMGDPPLWMDDADIEYRAQPLRSYRRYGNRISYNAYSMRNPDVSPAKTDPREIRVMVLGDSIVDGGATIDQESLATFLLEQRLGAALDRPVFVGNIAARGWSPCHYHAYVKKFGLFDADVVMIITNSGDYDRVPSFRRKRARRRPLLALEDMRREWVRKYQIARDARRYRPDAATRAKNIEICMEALREVIGMARSAGAEVLMAQYLWRSEIEGRPGEGHDGILQVARELGIEPLQLADAFARALRQGDRPFLGDARHPNALGQRIIAEVLFEPIRRAVMSRAE